MTNISVPITDEDLAARIQVAMYEALTDEAKSVLVRRAVDNLTTPSSFSRRTPLQDAFNSAVVRLVDKMMAEDEELQAKVEAAARGAIVDAVDQMISDEHGMRERVARALTDSLWRS